MPKQPYIPLYIGDWEQDVNGLSIEAEGAWLKIIFKCWRNEGSFAAPIDILARVCKVNPERMKSIIQEWRINNVCEISEQADGLILLTNRRIQREKQISLIRSEAGSNGGKASRNTRTKKLYDSPGFLYLVMDHDKHGEYKIGISKDPDKRLTGIKRSYKRTNLSIVFKWPVPDMGNYEDSILEYYKDVRDGEWIYMDVPPEQLRNEISSLIQKQNNSKPKTKEQQFTDNEIEYDIDNEVENERKEGVQGKENVPRATVEDILSEESLASIFDEIFLDILRKNYSHLDVDEELRLFKVKVRGSPEEYQHRDRGGIRLAFQYQLKTSKGSKGTLTNGKQTDKGTQHLTSLVEGFKRRHGKPAS